MIFIELNETGTSTIHDGEMEIEAFKYQTARHRFYYLHKLQCEYECTSKKQQEQD